MQLERLSTVCARLGLCSRAEATRYIKLGLVSVDGASPREAAALVSPGASVTLADRARRMQDSKVTLSLHKPLHYVACRATGGVPMARALLLPSNRAHFCRSRPDPRNLSRLMAADLLDEASSGLLIFSQDGRVSTSITRHLEKEYHVELPCGTVQSSHLAAFRAGLCDSHGHHAGEPTSFDDGISEATRRQVDVEHIPSEADGGSDLLRVLVRGDLSSTTLHQVCALAGLRPTSVCRTRIGSIRLAKLLSGQWTVVRTEDLVQSRDE